MTNTRLELFSGILSRITRFPHWFRVIGLVPFWG